MDMFFVEGGYPLHGSVRVDGLPTPPKGMRISHVDVVVRLVEDRRD